MPKMNVVVLKSHKDKPVRHRHHWIFSGAIHSIPDFENGDILPVESSTGDFLGYGYFHHHTSISGRMLSFDDTPGEKALIKNLDRAMALRKQLIGKDTTAYRLVNSEGDGIPGLVVDVYDTVVVLQIATIGIDRLKPLIVDHLKKILKPTSIYEKSTLPSRREEGIKDMEGLLAGESTDTVDITEHGLRFRVSIKDSQKTGFFLDQREMRQWVRELASKKKVLNCFGYTGGFSVYALAGGATQVDTVDISPEAITLAQTNAELNGFDSKKHGWFAEDAFVFLREQKLAYDLIILDPPAFAKKKTDIIAACRGYKDINRLAIEKIPSGGMILTSSCSYHVDEKLFQTVIFQAAHDAGRTVRIIGRHHLAPDHPINVYHPEGEYLKSLLLSVD